MKKIIAALVAAGTAAFICCAAIGDKTWKCSYTYDVVTGCSSMGFDMTTRRIGSSVVSAPDPVTACLAVSESTFALQRIHVICEPKFCEDITHITSPKMAPMDEDAGAVLLDVDAGDDAGPVITCPNDCSALITQAGAGEGQLFGCLTCVAGNSGDPTDPGYGCCQAYVQAVQLDPAEAATVLACWEASSTAPPGSQQCAPPSPAGAAASFNACMLLACQGPDRCGNPNFGTGGSGAGGGGL
jgi:hypothetical protein